MNKTTMSSKGQIVVPKPIRDALNLEPTDTLQVSLDASGKRIIVEPTLSVKSAYGMFSAKKSIDKKDIKAAKRKRLQNKFKNE